MNTRVPTISDPFRTGKTYSVAEAARLACTSPQNVRRWLLGYSAPGHTMTPVFGKKGNQGEPLAVSFLELVEVVIVAGFRKSGVSLQRARDAHQYARETFHLEYPFASLKLREQGGHILHEFEESSPSPGHLVVLDLRGQFVLPDTVRARVIEFDFDAKDRFVSKWFPFGRTTPVVVDPHIAAGAPTVKGSRVTVETLKKRWKGGEVIDSIEDLDLNGDDVEHILQMAA